MKTIVEAEAGDFRIDMTIDDSSGRVDAIDVSGRGPLRLWLNVVRTPTRYDRRWIMRTQNAPHAEPSREFADWQAFLGDHELRSRRDILGRACSSLAEVIGPDERPVPWQGMGLKGRIVEAGKALREFESDYGVRELTGLLRSVLSRHGYEVCPNLHDIEQRGECAAYFEAIEICRNFEAAGLPAEIPPAPALALTDLEAVIALPSRFG